MAGPRRRSKKTFILPGEQDAFVRHEISLFVSDEDVRRERNRARTLRRTRWWERKRKAGLCHYCGGKFAPSQITMDHIVPIAAGGRSIRSNLVPACDRCNENKADQLPTWEALEKDEE